MAAAEVLLVINVILGIFFALGIFFLWWKFSFFKGDEAILIIADTNNTNGRAIGLVLKEENVNNGRIKIYYSPLDSGEKDYKRNEIQSIITPKENVLVSHKGSWSRSRNIVWILPHEVDDIPEIFNKEMFSPLFTKVEERGGDTLRLKTLKLQLDRVASFLTELGDGEYSEELVSRYKDVASNILKLKDDLDKRKTSSSNTPNYSNYSKI